MLQVGRRCACAFHAHTLYPEKMSLTAYSTKAVRLSIKGAREKAKAFECSDATLYDTTLCGEPNPSTYGRDMVGNVAQRFV